MVTIYELLEVEENASKEEIEESYKRLILEYHQDPKLSAEENKENEMILNKLKIAYEILSNNEKRKRYDNDLSKKRAEDLIKNVSVKNNEIIDSRAIENQEESNNKNSNQNQYIDKTKDLENDEQEEVSLTEEEQEKLKKAAQREFNNNLKKAQKAEEQYKQAYNEVYNEYLRKMGYKQKQPWTLKRIKNLVITILVIILVCMISWIIPPVREMLIGIYEDNIIIKSLVDIVAMFVKAILSIFKK